MPLQIPAGRPRFPNPQTGSLEEGRSRGCGAENYPFPLCSFRKKRLSLRLFQGESPRSSRVPSLGLCAGNEDGMSGQFWREHSSSCCAEV